MEDIENWTTVDAVKKLREIYASEEYCKLKAKMSHTTYLEAMGNHRWETTYSSLLKWIFRNPEFDLNRGLNDTEESPIVFLLRLLATMSVEQEEHEKKGNIFNEELRSSVLINDVKVDVADVKTEQNTTGPDDGRIDLVIECNARFDTKGAPKNKRIRILLENKVGSKENKKNGVPNQCQKYYDYFSKQPNDGSRIDIYVFLSPKEPEALELSCHYFIKISYQNLLDSVLMPILHQSEHYSEKSKWYLQDFVDTITSIKINEKSKGNIAMDQETKKLLTKFFENNESLIYAAIKAGSPDEDYKKETDSARERVYQRFKLIYHGQVIPGAESVARRNVAFKAVEALELDGKDEHFINDNLKNAISSTFWRLAGDKETDEKAGYTAEVFDGKYRVNTRIYTVEKFEKLKDALRVIGIECKLVEDIEDSEE